MIVYLSAIFCAVRHQLTDLQSSHVRWNRLVGAANLTGRVGLQIPHVNVTRPALEIEHDTGLCPGRFVDGRPGFPLEQPRKSQSREHPGPANPQCPATRHSVTEAGLRLPNIDLHIRFSEPQIGRRVLISRCNYLSRSETTQARSESRTPTPTYTFLSTAGPDPHSDRTNDKGDRLVESSLEENHSAMHIILAAPRGFCAGVNMAIESLELALATVGPPVYVYHEIVHNQYVVERFRDEGAVFVDDLHEVPRKATLLYSAHGVAPAVRHLARERQLQTIDATCPLVTKVHLEAIRYAREGYTILLIGHKGHDEVTGTLGEAPDVMRLVENPGDVAKLDLADDAKVAYLTQTTLSVDDANRIIDALKDRFSSDYRASQGRYLLRHPKSPGGGQIPLCRGRRCTRPGKSKQLQQSTPAGTGGGKQDRWLPHRRSCRYRRRVVCRRTHGGDYRRCQRSGIGGKRMCGVSSEPFSDHPRGTIDS